MSERLACLKYGVEDAYSVASDLARNNGLAVVGPETYGLLMGAFAGVPNLDAFGIPIDRLPVRCVSFSTDRFEGANFLVYKLDLGVPVSIETAIGEGGVSVLVGLGSLGLSTSDLRATWEQLGEWLGGDLIACSFDGKVCRLSAPEAVLTVMDGGVGGVNPTKVKISSSCHLDLPEENLAGVGVYSQDLGMVQRLMDQRGPVEISASIGEDEPSIAGRIPVTFDQDVSLAVVDNCIELVGSDELELFRKFKSELGEYPVTESGPFTKVGLL